MWWGRRRICRILNIRKIDILSRNHTSPWLSLDTHFFFLALCSCCHLSNLLVEYPPFVYIESSSVLVLYCGMVVASRKSTRENTCIHWIKWKLMKYIGKFFIMDISSLLCIWICIIAKNDKNCVSSHDQANKTKIVRGHRM